MRIRTQKDYKFVLQKIDELLELSFLSKNQTSKLKSLLDALDEYQQYTLPHHLDARTDLVEKYFSNVKKYLN